MEDILFQGTVRGPHLWNAVFGDVRSAVQDMGFTEVVFADDLNAYKASDETASKENVGQQILACQARLTRGSVIRKKITCTSRRKPRPWGTGRLQSTGDAVRRPRDHAGLPC